MDNRQLEYFVAVAEELSFTRAAQRVFAVQSTVSAAIRALETELRTPLFERSTRAVALSPAGAALLPEAKAALDAFDRARAAVEETTTGLRGSLRIGTLTRLGVINLAALAGAFHERHPDVQLHLTASPEGSTGLAEDVRRSRLDLAFLGLPESELGGLDADLITDMPFVALVPRRHALADRREIELASLADEPFVDTLRGFGNRLVVDRAYEAMGRPRRVTVEVPDLPSVPAYVATGLGVAVIPQLTVQPGSNVVVVPLAGQPLTWSLYVATARGRRRSRPIEALLDLLPDHINPNHGF